MAGSRKLVVVLFGIGVLALLLYLGRPSARILPYKQVEAMWTQRMLEERSEDLHFIRAQRDPRISSPAEVVHVSSKGFQQFSRAIRIIDSRGSFLWGFIGLSGGGGWELKGGLLEEALLPARESLELFLMEAIYWQPALMPLWMNHFRKSGVSFKIFLVRRDQSTRRAEILRTWEIPPSQVEWKYLPNSNVLDPVTTASLAYDGKKRRATVIITGIDREITAQVDIDDKTR